MWRDCLCQNSIVLIHVQPLVHVCTVLEGYSLKEFFHILTAHDQVLKEHIQCLSKVGCDDAKCSQGKDRLQGLSILAWKSERSR
jgi:hypothetical protein